MAITRRPRPLVTLGRRFWPRRRALPWRRVSGRNGSSGCRTFGSAPAFPMRIATSCCCRAWEAAVARQLGDVGIDLDREATLLGYARHFDLDDGELDHNGMLRQFVQGAAITESAAGLVPKRMHFLQGVAASALLRRSEQLVWLFDDVEYCLGQLPAEPSPTITGVAAPGRDLLYYPQQSFVDLQVPDQGWESVARGQLAVASEHLHFHGPGLNIRLAYGPVVNWEPYRDGIGAVPRAQPNRLVVFRNGDG